ncbi:hypothetical protein J437_LFUL000947 [Ladona fulva]|uniref:Uncharacterized protein n=1 Tax=Ladona fulva TaxID=123851 RepID=A0A8K0K6T0_LADFU|nr:hypothetical protein J437_LFUL000947 [Ladona fulva]
MEEGLFEPIANITKLYISQSGCKNFPRSFRMLQKLEYLEISETSLEWIGDDLCSQSFALKGVMIKTNPLLDIHPECLQSYNNSEDIELSGNFISNLPNRTVVLSKLITFKFNDNGCDVKSVENFLMSDSLLYIEMKNSSIFSIHKDFLRNVPNLRRIDLSDNKLTHLEEGFFEFSVNLRYVSLRGNRLTSIPVSLLDTKPLLSEIIVSHNKISEINFKVGQNLSSLTHLDISYNDITLIPSNPFSRMPNIKFLDVSNNKISEIDKVVLEVISDLESLHIDQNRMKGDFFLLPRKFEHLTNLSAESNNFSELSWLNIPLLYELNLANNLIQKLNLSVFNSCPNLGILKLSRNLIGELPGQIFSHHLRHLTSLDLSFNRLKTHPDYIHLGIWMGRDRFVTVFYNLQLDLLDLSGNLMEKFELNWLGDAKSIQKVFVRNNNISELYTNSSEAVPVFSLDLSHNKISSKNWPWYYDDLLKTSGKISPFGRFEYLKELHLAHNEITDIPIDFRIHNAHLKVLDLSFNKIKHLTHQELLFSSYQFDADGNAKPYDFCRSLTINLRNNLIGRINFPHFMVSYSTFEFTLDLHGYCHQFFVSRVL